MQSGRVRPGGLKVRRRTGPIAVAAVIAALIAEVYSALLGFGVNERCDTLALCHTGTQVVLVIVAGIGGVSVWRAGSGWRRSGLMAAVALIHVSLVVTAVVVYTDAAWSWANSRG